MDSKTFPGASYDRLQVSVGQIIEESLQLVQGIPVWSKIFPNLCDPVIQILSGSFRIPQFFMELKHRFSEFRELWEAESGIFDRDPKVTR